MAAVTPVPIVPPPGVVLNEAERVTQGRYVGSNMVRFRAGLPQKRGGWALAYATATSGMPRALHAWRDNGSSGFIAAGTYRKLYGYDENLTQNDITPIRASGTLANNSLTTTSGSPYVSVAHTGHGLNVGDTLVLAGSSAVGGITPNGTFTVFTVTSANAYVFQFTSNASSSATGGGAAVTYSYEIGIGTELGAYGLGWGVGGWGIGTWGSIHSSSTVFIEPRVWSLDHFGQILLAGYNGGTIYSFDPTQAHPWARAQIIADAPDDVRAMFVTPERFVIALRTGMIVHGSSQSDYTDWTPSSSNTSFTRTLTEGTKLVGGRALGPFVSLIWSDGALYRLEYTGSSLVYNTSLAGKDCGLLAPGAAVTVDGIAYWMGPDNFWMYDGAVHKMPNVEDIREHVFDGLPPSGLYQCHAVYNPHDNEIEFFFPTGDDENPFDSVIYSIPDRCWAPNDWGSIGRVAGTHFTQGDTRPYMGGTDGYIYQHENTLNANGSAISWSLVLGAFALSEGLVNIDVEGILFDFASQVGDIQALVETRDRLNDTDTMDSETETVSTTSGMIDFRLSGRYLTLTLSGDELAGYFRGGKHVAFVKPSGRRR